MTTTKIDTKKNESKAEEAVPKPIVKEGIAKNKMEAPAFLQQMAGKSADQAREGSAKVKPATEEASVIMEDAMEVMRDGFMEMNLKAIDAAKDNSEAVLSHMRELFGVNNISEAMELQSCFGRKQYDTVSKQVNDIQVSASKLATTVSQQAKEVLYKSMKDMNIE